MTRITPSLLLFILSVGFFLTSDAWCKPASSIMATATANVVEAVSITSQSPLSFGFIKSSGTNGTVTVSPDNKCSATNGIKASSSFTHAEFAVRGMPGHSYSIHAPSSLTFSIREQGNNDENNRLLQNLVVTNFVTYSVTEGNITSSGKLNAAGKDSIYLGATLIVPANAAPGVYSGLVPLTVSY